MLLLPARFEFSEDLRTRLLAPAQVVPVFDRVVMHGHKGAVATVEISPGTFVGFGDRLTLGSITISLPVVISIQRWTVGRSFLITAICFILSVVELDTYI